jgi:hypothetical protein
MSIKDTQLEKGMLPHRCYATLHSVSVGSGIRTNEEKDINRNGFCYPELKAGKQNK